MRELLFGIFGCIQRLDQFTLCMLTGFSIGVVPALVTLGMVQAWVAHTVSPITPSFYT